MTIGEAVIWIAFYLLQAIGISILVYSTNHGKVPVMHLVLVTLFKLLLNIIFFLPLWWFFFYKLKHLSLKAKAWLHLAVAPVFAVLWTAVYGVFLITSEFDPKYGLITGSWDAYQTAFHYLLVFAMFHAYNFWIDAKQKLIKEKELKELAYQSEIKALKAQIEPHFLFNTLNSISASVPPNLEKTRVLIAQLADTFRYALQSSENNWIRLEDEMHFIRTWLSLEKQRLDDRLTVNYLLDETVLHEEIPPMILQPIVENAIKHGISSQIEGGTVTIECKRDNNFINISVCDTGPGFDGELADMFKKGIGLKNISERLQRLYNKPLHIKRKEQGLVFSFCIPTCRNAYEKGNNY